MKPEPTDGGITANYIDASSVRGVARKYVSVIGNMKDHTFTVVHQLGTTEVIVNCYRAENPADIIWPLKIEKFRDSVILHFSGTPAKYSITVVIVG